MKHPPLENFGVVFDRVQCHPVEFFGEFQQGIAGYLVVCRAGRVAQFFGLSAVLGNFTLHLAIALTQCRIEFMPKGPQGQKRGAAALPMGRVIKQKGHPVSEVPLSFTATA
jgi:hypothetical protein